MERIVAGARMQSALVEHLRAIGVEEDEVSVAPDCDRALRGIEAEDARGIRAEGRDEVTDGQVALTHALRIHELHLGLEGGDAEWHPREVLETCRSLLGRPRGSSGGPAATASRISARRSGVTSARTTWNP